MYNYALENFYELDNMFEMDERCYNETYNE